MRQGCDSIRWSPEGFALWLLLGQRHMPVGHIYRFGVVGALIKFFRNIQAAIARAVVPDIVVAVGAGARNGFIFFPVAIGQTAGARHIAEALHSLV